MIIAFAISSLFCFAYYVVLVVYTGSLIASQNYIWLIFALGFIIAIYMIKVYRNNPKRIPLWIIVSSITICAAGILILVVTEVFIVSDFKPGLTPKLDYVIVLGAKVEEDGTLSKTLQVRLDTAIQYLDDNPNSILVLSGGQGQDEPFSEAEGMAEYLMYNGVRYSSILVEIQSKNTYENIIYSQALIKRIRNKDKKDNTDGEIKIVGPVLVAEDRPAKIGILSSDYHLFRAMSIAKKAGFVEIYGISAESDNILFLHQSIREGFAVFKDKFLGRI